VGNQLVRQRRPVVPHRQHRRSHRTTSELGHHRDRETTTPATSMTSSRTSGLNASMTCRHRTTLLVHNHAASRHHRSDGTMPTTNRRRSRGAAPIHVFKGGLTPAQGMVAFSLPSLFWWVVAIGQEDLVEVPPHEVSGSTATVAEVFRGTAAVSSIMRRTGSQPNVMKTQHYVPVPTQSHFLVVVEAEVADATCAGGSVVIPLITRRDKQLSSASTSSRVPRRCRQTTGLRETVLGVRQRATGLRHLPSARNPSKTTPTVRSTADFRPNLDWDAGRIADFDGYCRQA